MKRRHVINGRLAELTRHKVDTSSSIVADTSWLIYCIATTTTTTTTTTTMNYNYY